MICYLTQAVILHDVAGHLPELAQVPLLPVDGDVPHLSIDITHYSACILPIAHICINSLMH